MSSPSHLRERLAHWVELWRDVVRARSVPQDVLAGLTVAAVALPLNLALAVASGLPPAAGLISGAVGGGVAAMLGGSALQVTGPAAALSVLVLAIARDFGVVGVAAAAVIVGVSQIALGALRGGRVIHLLPEAVVAGFTTGVGLKLLDIQIPELLGFDYRVLDLALMMHRPLWLHEVSWLSVVCGLAVAFLVVTLRPHPRVPAALLGIGVVTFLANFLGWEIARVGALPASLPAPSLPLVADDRWLDLLVATLPLAVLASAESLISARAVDRMAPHVRAHDSDLELLGQGAANIAAGIFSGMPVTGVIVRSGTNVQSGARTRLSALVHALGLLAVIVWLAAPIARVPLAGLAGLLCVVGTRLIEVKTFRHLVHADRLGAVAFALTAAGTASGHLVAGLAAGVAVHFAGRYLAPRRAAIERPREPGVRAVLGRERADARRPATAEPAPDTKWLRHIREPAHVASSAFVHEQANVVGRVVLGEDVHIAAGSSVRADEGSPFFFGSATNLQDGVTVHALKERRVLVAGEEWAVYVGRNVSLAHGALVHGPCYIGDDTFVGFNAVVHDSIVGARCFVGIGAVVVGVEVPDGKLVPHGAIVDSAEAVEKLGPVSDTHRHFNEDVVQVNRGLVAAYREHRRSEPLVLSEGPQGPSRRTDDLELTTPIDRF